MSHNNDYMAEQINSRLAGLRIKGSVVSADGESFGFMVITQQGKEFPVWIDQDAEGNGPGWLSFDNQ